MATPANDSFLSLESMKSLEVRNPFKALMNAKRTTLKAKKGNIRMKRNNGAHRGIGIGYN